MTSFASGLARNTAAAVQFLDSCEAVKSYSDLNDDWIEFMFDATADVFSAPDHLVWFDVDSAPEDGIETFNRCHNCDQ